MFNFNFQHFEKQILENDYFIGDHFFNKDQIKNVQAFLKEKKHFFSPAKIGKNNSTILNSQIRSDSILWIDDWNKTQELKDFKLFLDTLQNFCRENFFLPLKRFESHFAFYPQGSFYQKHLDQHKNSPNRHISVVLYLSDFKNGNGGQLKIYPINKEKSPIEVDPIAGRIVVFKSAGLLHEVLETKAERFSITSWIRDDLE